MCVVQVCAASARRWPSSALAGPAQALQAAGRDPEYVVYEGEGHRWQRADHRIDFARRLERFLAQHLRDPSSPAAPGNPP